MNGRDLYDARRVWWWLGPSSRLGRSLALRFYVIFSSRLSVQGKYFDGTLVDLEKCEVAIALKCIGVGSLRRAFVGGDAIVGLTVLE